MKTKRILTFLLLGFFTLSCNDIDQIHNNTNKKDSQKIKKQSITGVWIIKKFYFSDISAMDEKTASEWLNQTLIIDDKIHFDFEKIGIYKEVFKDESECEIINLNKPEIIKSSDYFDAIRSPLADLRINETSIKIFKTKCKDNPFSEFVLTENNDIIINWDGAFFVLTRK